MVQLPGPAKTKTIALSTTEAEFVASCETAKEILWLQQLLLELVLNFGPGPAFDYVSGLFLDFDPGSALNFNSATSPNSDVDEARSNY
ncbi:Retrovirus-related Pol polyprotein from transposon TNT 1-94 [Eumeta japonica]|uniref:Retrovirus-related Pol polyprotein from transposon TNT 1-94 n=1 Tax=Eumeta variegata TaxID=151549 RepID=A0A4C2A5D7_EUMVA|nr:Retrovirus-related Pol polyprotein from transposon TNT 1-94 [Eumeta japonica]